MFIVSHNTCKDVFVPNYILKLQPRESVWIQNVAALGKKKVFSIAKENMYPDFMIDLNNGHLSDNDFI